MSRSLIERAEGNGRVFSGEKLLGAVSYTVLVFQGYIHVENLTGSGDIPGMQEYELDITPSMPVSRQLLTLELSDQRKLNFYMVSQAGTMPTGGFF